MRRARTFLPLLSGVMRSWRRAGRDAGAGFQRGLSTPNGGPSEFFHFFWRDIFSRHDGLHDEVLAGAAIQSCRGRVQIRQRRTGHVRYWHRRGKPAWQAYVGLARCTAWRNVQRVVADLVQYQKRRTWYREVPWDLADPAALLLSA